MPDLVAYLIITVFVAVIFILGRISRRKRPLASPLSDHDFMTESLCRKNRDDYSHVESIITQIRYDVQLQGVADDLLYDLRAVSLDIHARVACSKFKSSACRDDPDFALLEKGLEWMKRHKKWRDNNAADRVRAKLALEGLS